MSHEGPAKRRDLDRCTSDPDVEQRHGHEDDLGGLQNETEGIHPEIVSEGVTSLQEEKGEHGDLNGLPEKDGATCLTTNVFRGK